MARQKKRNIQIFSGNFKKKEIGILNYWRLPGQHSWPIRPFAHEETLRRVPILFREEFCRYMIVAFLEDGHLDYFCDGKEYHLSAGDLIVIPSGSTYRFQTTHPHFYHKKVIEFKGVNLVSICETLGLNKVHCLSLDTPEEFLGLFHEIGALIQSREPKNIPLLLGKCHELLSFLSFRISAVRQTRNLLNTIVERLEHDLDEPLPIRDLAAELHMSVSDSGWAKFGWGKIYGQWIVGATIVAYDTEKFHAPQMLELIQRIKLTTFCAPPTVYRFLLKEDMSNMSNIGWFNSAMNMVGTP